MRVRTRVRAHRFLDVRGACVRRKKQSQPMPCLLYVLFSKFSLILYTHWLYISQNIFLVREKLKFLKK